MVTHICVSRRVNDYSRLNSAEAGLGRHDEVPHPAVAHHRILHKSMKQDGRARLNHEALPHDLELFGNVGDAGAGSVRVGPLHDRSDPAAAASGR